MKEIKIFDKSNQKFCFFMRSTKKIDIFPPLKSSIITYFIKILNNTQNMYEIAEFTNGVKTSVKI